MDNSQNFTVKELPENRRPYEKCSLYGARSLTDSELLAVFLRSGTKDINCVELASMVIDALPGRGIAGILNVDKESLMELPGIGNVKAIQFECLAELSRRIIKNDIYDKQKKVFGNSEVIANYFMNSMRQLESEVVMLLLFNVKCELIKEIEISHGSFEAASLSPRDVFYYALKNKAYGIVLLHNHPSGDPTPSTEDIKITGRIYSTACTVGINLLDHIVIGDNKYVSMRERGFFGT
ncbi:MAG: DNA repair protein RadC [Lachnospiraceae bacterium]|nr:DNA repair protein RadC [Lachnospiraceae bacterium]